VPGVAKRHAVDLVRRAGTRSSRFTSYSVGPWPEGRTEPGEEEEEAASQRFEIESDGVPLAAEEAGDGTPVVLLHGLTATRRYVVHGSRLLERSGHRVIAYDARGHGESGRPDSPEAYEYSDLRRDLLAVLDDRGLEGTVLAGSSMGAHTAAGLALEAPKRVSALVLITPAYDGRPADPSDLADWDRLAAALRSDGVDGFLDAWNPDVDPRYRETVEQVVRQRLERHHDLEAVADALAVVPRSAPFDGLDALARIGAPCLVVGSRDGADPGHPLTVAERWAEELPDGELSVEEEGDPPLAWQGAQLSREIARFLERRELGE
jgi:pimeloyl-ACP methyl ester carboxylesterase